MTEFTLIPGVAVLPESELESFIRRRAERIVSNTQGDSWDDPEEWQVEAVELAHAVYRLFSLPKSGGD